MFQDAERQVGMHTMRQIQQKERGAAVPFTRHLNMETTNETNLEL